MALTPAEKERVRYHLGYPETNPSASIQLGIPRPLQTMFLVEAALNYVMPEAEFRIRHLVAVMDGIEQQLVEAQPRLAATKLDELTLREDETTRLEYEYVRWGCRLADVLGVPIYAYSTRYMGKVGSTVAGSVRIRG
jgi:hypothetical protein